jgi:predicted nucleic acid-binding protein
VQLKVTADSSVLLALGKLGYLELLGELFDKIFVAKSVFEEISEDQTASDITELKDAGLVEVAKCSNTQLFNLLSSSLGKGEAESIALALELKADAALLDDLRARKKARRLNVKVIGTLALLRALLDLELIKEKPEELCQRLIDQGFWVDPGLCVKILKEKQD